MAPLLYLGRLRDAKNPTIGPVELNVPGTTDTVVHRYVYDGNHLAQVKRACRDASDALHKTSTVATISVGSHGFMSRLERRLGRRHRPRPIGRPGKKE